MDEEQLAHRFAEAIYGTVIAAGVLVAVSDESQPDAGAAAAYAFVTVVVFWLAHAWAHTLGRRAAGAATPGGFTGSLVADSPLVLSAVPALAGLGLALILGASDETALAVASWVCVALLGIWGAAIGVRERQSPVRVALTAGGSAALGLIMIGLKSVLG
jgi:hypothetical protein